MCYIFNIITFTLPPSCLMVLKCVCCGMTSVLCVKCQIHGTSKEKGYRLDFERCVFMVAMRRVPYIVMFSRILTRGCCQSTRRGFIWRSNPWDNKELVVLAVIKFFHVMHEGTVDTFVFGNEMIWILTQRCRKTSARWGMAYAAHPGSSLISECVHASIANT